MHYLKTIRKQADTRGEQTLGRRRCHWVTLPMLYDIEL